MGSPEASSLASAYEAAGSSSSGMSIVRRRKLEAEQDESIPQAKRSKADHHPDPGDNAGAANKPVEPSAITDNVHEPKSHSNSAVNRGKTKEKRHVGRQRRGTRVEGSSAPGDESIDKNPRLPKRLCALLIGYSGAGFYGMQIQPDVKTIEGVLFQALVQAGAVSRDNADDPVKVGLQRAARTDAGVHAAGNVVSMKIITSIPGVPDLLNKVNEELPPEIRLWSYVGISDTCTEFLQCPDVRVLLLHELPHLMQGHAGIFLPGFNGHEGSGFWRNLHAGGQSKPSDDFSRSENMDVSQALDGKDVHEFWRGQKPDSSREEDMQRKKKCRIGPGPLAALRETAKKYEGTHNFHNFTVGKDFKERTSQRFMKKIEIGEPAVYGDTEWISVMFHGQSFMLHQASGPRKMMCVLVLTCRTGTSSSIVDELYGPKKVIIPKMPSLGLLLEYPIFESYNDRMAKIVNDKLQPTDADYRPPIDFEEHRAAIDKFKQDQIYDRMRDSEERCEIFDRWIRSIDCYAGNDLLYYNAKGIIPDAAVIKTGERRSNPFKEKRKFDVTDFTKREIQDEAEQDDEVDEEQEVENLDKKKLADMEG